MLVLLVGMFGWLWVKWLLFFLYLIESINAKENG